MRPTRVVIRTLQVGNGLQYDFFLGLIKLLVFILVRAQKLLAAQLIFGCAGVLKRVLHSVVSVDENWLMIGHK